MSAGQPSLSVRQEGEITIIGFRPGQQILSRPSVEGLGAEFAAAIESSPSNKFIVSFEGVEYVSSMVLGTLVSSLMTIQKRGGELRIASVTEDLALLFRLTGLQKVFEICEDLESAARSLSAPRKPAKKVK